MLPDVAVAKYQDVQRAVEEARVRLQPKPDHPGAAAVVRPPQDGLQQLEGLTRARGRPVDHCRIPALMKVLRSRPVDEREGKG